MPFGLVVPLNLRTAGNTDGWAQPARLPASLDSSRRSSSTGWSCDRPADEQAYRTFIESYITEQKQQGRFERPLNYRVSTHQPR